MGLDKRALLGLACGTVLGALPFLYFSEKIFNASREAQIGPDINQETIYDWFYSNDSCSAQEHELVRARLSELEEYNEYINGFLKTILSEEWPDSTAEEIKAASEEFIDTYPDMEYNCSEKTLSQVFIGRRFINRHNAAYATTINAQVLLHPAFFEVEPTACRQRATLIHEWAHVQFGWTHPLVDGEIDVENCPIYRLSLSIDHECEKRSGRQIMPIPTQ